MLFFSIKDNKRFIAVYCGHNFALYSHKDTNVLNVYMQIINLLIIFANLQIYLKKKKKQQHAIILHCTMKLNRMLEVKH